MTTLHEQPHYEEDRFIKDLLQKYPSIWPKGNDGLPTTPRSGFDCPPGWRSIVENACRALHSRVINSRRTIPNPDKGVRFRAWLFRRLWMPVHARLNKWLDPYEPYRPRPYPKNGWCVPKDVMEKARKSRRYTWQKKLSHLTHSVLSPKNQYLTVPACEGICIHQVKEKFGGLRIYTGGAGEVEEGILYSAEIAAYHTCEITGKPGECCIRGGWYKTLCPEEAQRMGFTPVPESD